MVSQSAADHKQQHEVNHSCCSLQGEEEDPTPFFEPLLRSLVLGVGTGVIFESGHVALQVNIRLIKVVPVFTGLLVATHVFQGHSCNVL